MPNARELLKLGQLSAAIEQLTQEVKSSPTDVSSRIFLFELLSLAGDYDRAEKQLEVIGHQSTEMQIGVGVYKRILAAERARQAVFTGNNLPTFITLPPEYTALHLEALSRLRDGKPAEARESLEKAMELHPALAGTVDGQAFEEFGDSDLFLGPILEVIHGDRYVWLPLEEIKRLEFRKPNYLRDAIWIGAQVEARSGDLGEIFVPVLYPGTCAHADDAVKLGRVTDWVEVGSGLTRGAGQRLFLIDDKERAVLEIKEIVFSEKAEERASEGSSK